MSLPKFPEVPRDMTCRQSITQILTSIAMEEVSLSHILNAEGEKLQYILGTLDGFTPPAPPTVDQVLEVNQSVRDTLQQVAFNQMFLSAKMSEALKALSHCHDADAGNDSGDGSGNNGSEPVRPPTDPDRRVTLAQPNGWAVIEKGGSTNITGSIFFDFESSDERILTGTKAADDNVRVNGLEAGVAVMAVGNSRGAVSCYTFQIRDPERISEYTVKNGGKVFFTDTGITRPCPVTATPSSAQGSIAWVSLNPGIVTVTRDGSLKSVAKGAAIVIGTFTDTWGMQREIILLVSVDVTV